MIKFVSAFLLMLSFNSMAEQSVYTCRDLYKVHPEDKNAVLALTLRAQKIDPATTKEDLEDFYDQGIRSGKFCEEYPKLYSLYQAKKYVLDQVRERVNSSVDL